MAKKGQKFKTYSPELKRTVVMERLKGVSLSILCNKFNISSDGMIVRWVNDYKMLGDEAFVDKRQYIKEQIPTKGRPKTKFDSPEEENKALRLESEYLKKQEVLKRGCSVEELNLWSSKNLK